MAPRYQSGSGAAAAIAGHPLHPLIVPLPIGAFVGAFVSDIAYLSTHDAFWSIAAYWLIIAGLIAGAVAALLGIIDLMSIRRARTMGIGWAHASLNVVAMAISLVSYLMRHTNPEGVAGDAGAYLTGSVVALLAVSGWLGGELVFRHGVSVGTNVGAVGETADHEIDPSGRPDTGQA
jgi:uncharacterized membrane protein